MKKLLKRVLCIVALAAVCLSFASCKQLDEMKSKQACWKDGKNGETIIFRDHEYYRLPEDENFVGISSDYDYGYVTESDVPVLLSANGARMYFDKKDVSFIRISEGIIYCIDDRYNEIIKMFDNYELDNFCYDSYSIVDDRDEGYMAVKKLVGDKVKEALEKTLGSEAVAYEGESSRMSGPCIYVCDKSMYFISESTYYWVVIENDEAYVLTEQDAEVLFYSVPDEYYDVMVDFCAQKDHFSNLNNDPFVDTEIIQ